MQLNKNIEYENNTIPQIFKPIFNDDWYINYQKNSELTLTKQNIKDFDNQNFWNEYKISGDANSKLKHYHTTYLFAKYIQTAPKNQKTEAIEIFLNFLIKTNNPITNKNNFNTEHYLNNFLKNDFYQEFCKIYNHNAFVNRLDDEKIPNYNTKASKYNTLLKKHIDKRIETITPEKNKIFYKNLITKLTDNKERVINSGSFFDRKSEDSQKLVEKLLKKYINQNITIKQLDNYKKKENKIFWIDENNDNNTYEIIENIEFGETLITNYSLYMFSYYGKTLDSKTSNKKIGLNENSPFINYDCSGIFILLEDKDKNKTTYLYLTIPNYLPLYKKYPTFDYKEPTKWTKQFSDKTKKIDKIDTKLTPNIDLELKNLKIDILKN